MERFFLPLGNQGRCCDRGPLNAAAAQLVMHNLQFGSFRIDPRAARVVWATMNISRLAVLVGGITFGAVAGAAFQLSSVSAAVPTVGHASVAASAPVAAPTPSALPTLSCPPRALAIAF